MNSQLENILFDTYSTLFAAVTDETVTDSDSPPPIAKNGIDCDDGWYRIILHLCESLATINETLEDRLIHITALQTYRGILFVKTTDRPQQAALVIEFAQRLSSDTCELCGTTTGAQVHTSGTNTHKTLCEQCSIGWKDTETDIEIWRFSMNCHRCNADTPVVYPRGLGGNHGGTWDTVGECLTQKPYCTVEQVYSSVQDQFVWGNMCESCGAYQGNFYVYQAAMETVEQANGWYPISDFDCIDIVTVGER